MRTLFPSDCESHEDSVHGAHLKRTWPVRLATLGPVGLIRFAPGTWGSLTASILAYGLFFPLSLWLRLAVLVGLFFFGAWCASRSEEQLGRKDPREVVIDEVLGQWLTYLPLVWPSIFDVAVGFILFRVFDILKPPPIHSAENWLPAGYGVMLDDALAGVYACIGLWCLHVVV